MFINAVVIVLQEILEAALMLSLLLAFLRHFNRVHAPDALLRKSWVVYSIVFGLVFAWLYSENLGAISASFDYVGLELTNASIHFVTFACLLLIAWVFPLDEENSVADLSAIRLRVLMFSMMSVVMLAILREGSEIFQFGGGLIKQEEGALSFIAGGLIGAGIGVSAGVLLYFGLTGLSIKKSLAACVLLLALTAGNMASQTVLLLTQADWLPYTAAAWNSEALLSEASAVGELAYALIGYESTPSWAQAAVYGLGILGVLLSPVSRKLGAARSYD